MISQHVPSSSSVRHPTSGFASFGFVGIGAACGFLRGVARLSSRLCDAVRGFLFSPSSLRRRLGLSGSWSTFLSAELCGLSRFFAASLRGSSRLFAFARFVWLARLCSQLCCTVARLARLCSWFSSPLRGAVLLRSFLRVFATRFCCLRGFFAVSCLSAPDRFVSQVGTAEVMD